MFATFPVIERYILQVLDIMEKYRSRNSDPSVSQQKGTSSSGDKCSICLGIPIFDEASLDGCSHKYCYPCITEWIKLRPICPMCKRPVAKVTHQVKVDSDAETTEEISVETIQRQAIRERIEADSVRPLIRERAELVRRIRHLQRLVRLHDHVFNERQRSEMLESDSRRHEYVDRINRYQLLLDNWERPRREIISDPTFRILVYELRLQRVPVVNTINTGIRRNSVSPQYFRDNEINERTRISEFVQRELNAIVPGANNLERVVELVYNLAKTHQIMSPQFTSGLRKECFALINFVDHFVELLYEFAVSGQEISLFDQNSEYISRVEYRRRLTNMNLMLAGDNIDDDIQVELDNLYPPNRNQTSGQILTHRVERMSPSHLHFVSAYTDALISLQRLLLILETTDETLPPNDETTLGDTIEAIIQACMEYRHRMRNRRENSNQRRMRQNNDRNGEIILSDDDDDEQGLSSITSRENSTVVSHNRRRFERLHRRRRSQRLMGLQARHGSLHSGFDIFRHGYVSRMLLGIDRTRDVVNSVRDMLSVHPNISFTEGPGEVVGVNASLNSDAIIDLEGPSTLGDDDVMVISESFEVDRHGRNVNNDDILIDDDAQEPRCHN
uniref:RING-type E3 ubiquitin transferase n=2 Tax=Brugia TaxID=6278 RepID=A0A0J9XTK1_BRUMA|nr:Bm9805 [Brugia malayi]